MGILDAESHPFWRPFWPNACWYSIVLRLNHVETKSCWDSIVLRLKRVENQSLRLSGDSITETHLSVETQSCWDSIMLKLNHVETQSRWDSFMLRINRAETQSCWDSIMLKPNRVETQSTWSDSPYVQSQIYSTEYRNAYKKMFSRARITTTQVAPAFIIQRRYEHGVTTLAARDTTVATA